MNDALKLWIEWFEWSGNPWIVDDLRITFECFFCGEEQPNHSENCVFVKAEKMINEYRKSKLSKDH